MRGRDIRRWPLGAFAAIALLVPAAAAADDFFHETLRASAESPVVATAGPAFDGGCPALRCRQRHATGRLDFGAAPGLGAALVEIPGAALPGQPKRPHYALGVRSHSLESTLNEMGIGARHCLAPLVRMHTRLSSGFALSGSIWIYLRCTTD